MNVKLISEMANPFKRMPRNTEFPDDRSLGGPSVASPYADNSHLARIFPPELIGPVGVDTLSVQVAMTLPAVQAVRNVLTQTIGSLPLRAYDKKNVPLEPQPLWLTKTNDEFQSAYDRTNRTLDDFLFWGYSLWEIVETGVEGFPLDVYHVPLQDWTTRQGRVFIREREAARGTYIYYKSPFPGLMAVAGRTMSHYLSIEETVLARSTTPNPLLLLKETEETEYSDELIEADMQAYREARQSIGGGVAHVRYGMDVVIPGLPENAQAFLLEARNAVATDIARFTGIPSALLEGTGSIDSLTYVTEAGQQSRFLNFSLRQWADPIQTRLSVNDVTPNGTRIAFDLTELVGQTQTAGFDAPEDAEPDQPALTSPAPTQEVPQ